jgi:hypothetical protein
VPVGWLQVGDGGAVLGEVVGQAGSCRGAGGVGIETDRVGRCGDRLLTMGTAVPLEHVRAKGTSVLDKTGEPGSIPELSFCTRM